MVFRVSTHALAAFFCILALILASGPSRAQDDAMSWQLNEFNDPDNKGRMTATLTYGVPETDNIQVTGVCDAAPSTSSRFSQIRFAADIGELKSGTEIKLRFSGGGFEHEVDGEIDEPKSEEDTTGVIIRPKHGNPIWKAMTEKKSIDYQVPGYRAASLKIEGDADTIRAFLEACKTFEAAHLKQTAEQQKPPKPDTPTKPEPNKKAASDINEKEAYDSAKELGTVDAWQAYLKSFPGGFRADLARAYVRRLGGDPETTPISPPPAAAAVKSAAAPKPKQAETPPQPPLQTLNLGAGSAPWRTGNRVVATADNQSLFTASVQGKGVELVTYCIDWSRTGGVGHGLRAVLRENPRGIYPDFDRRIRQGLANATNAQDNKRLQISFSNGKSFDELTARKEIKGGELSLGAQGQEISQGMAFKEMLSGKTMTISAPPFSTTFQLTNSRAAICEVFKRCGATGRPECAKFGSRNTTKKSASRKRSGSRCGSASVWLEGQCIRKAEVTSFCGPGYKRSGSKCVTRYPDQ